MKKRHFSSILIALAMLAIGAACAYASGYGDASARHAKARHYFLEGSDALAEGRASEAYELLRKAAQTDPEYSEAAYAAAMMRLTMRNDTLSSPTETLRSINMMRAFVDTYPGETGEAMNYSFLSARGGNLEEAIRVAERSDSLAADRTPILLQLAHYYALGQQNDKAISTLDRYERIEGPDPDLALRKLSLMFGMADTARLLAESERLVRENPVSPEYVVIRGNVYEALQMPDSALAAYEKAERMAPDDGRVKLTLANFWLERGDSAAYDEKSAQAILSETLGLDEKLEMMRQYMQNIISDSTADRRRGARLFDGLLRQYPHEPGVLDLGGQYAAATGDLQKAAELMEYATDLDPDNEVYWTRLASILLSDDKCDKAADACRRADAKLAEMPESLLFVWGSADARLERYAEVREIYGRLLEMALPGATFADSPSEILAKAGRLPYDQIKKIALIFQTAGDTSYKEGDLDRGVREYEVAVALDGSDPMALNNYAYYLSLTGRELDRAEQMSRTAVEEKPDNPTYIDTLAWILYLKGQYAEALELQEKALELVGDDDHESAAELWNHMGDIQYRSGLRDKALESWKKARDFGMDDKSLTEKIKLRKIPD